MCVLQDTDEAEEPVRSADSDDESTRPVKRRKKEQVPGVIYLSSIPEGMQYSDVYKIFSELGEIGRISLQVGGNFFCHSFVVVII